MRFVVLVLMLRSQVAIADLVNPPAPMATCPPASKLASEARLSAPTTDGLSRLAARTKILLDTAPDADCRSSLVEIFYDHYNAQLVALNEQINSLPEADRTKLHLNAVGWEIFENPDGAFAHESVPWLSQALGPRVPAAWRDYIQLVIAFRIQPQSLVTYEEDEGFELSWRELRLYVRRWEDFIARHPTFVRVADARAEHQRGFGTFLSGRDRREAFDGKGRLTQVYRSELEAYAADPHAARRTLV